MPPFISPESVKELNEVMCVTKDNWTPIPMYCSNCGALLYGYRNDEGKIKYECKRCGTVVNPFIGVIPTHGELEDELEQIYEAM